MNPMNWKPHPSEAIHAGTAAAGAALGSSCIRKGSGRGIRVVINADDFGRASEVNAAIEQAHRNGILTSASLMVGEPFAADAFAIARRNPGLAVGLHLTLTDGTPVLPPERIPALVGSDGRFHADMAILRSALVKSASARRQLRAEIEAQFAAFLARAHDRCDHVNTHQNQHLHPVIAGIVFRAAVEHGVSCVRLPWEPQSLLRKLDPVLPIRPAGVLLRRARAGMLWALARRFGLRTPHAAIGQAWTGRFTGERLAALISQLGPGVTEIYLHPATAGGFPGAAADIAYVAEFAALLDPRAREAVAPVCTGGYAAMLGYSAP